MQTKKPQKTCAYNAKSENEEAKTKMKEGRGKEEPQQIEYNNLTYFITFVSARTAVRQRHRNDAILYEIVA